jgi:hypothetical protein
MKRCIEPFATASQRGVSRVYAAGDEVLDDDPILRTHGKFFEDAEVELQRRRGHEAVERATAAPGERRQLSDPPARKRAARKRAAKKAAAEPPDVKPDPPKSDDAKPADDKGSDEK